MRKVDESAEPVLIPPAIKNDRWYESLFGAPPPLLPLGNPARDTNRRNRWKTQRLRRLGLALLPRVSRSHRWYVHASPTGPFIARRAVRRCATLQLRFYQSVNL